MQIQSLLLIPLKFLPAYGGFFPRLNPRRHHISGSYGFDLLQYAEFGLRQQFIKVADDLVEESETLESFFIDITLFVKLFVVWNGGEHDRYVFVSLAVQILL